MEVSIDKIKTGDQVAFNMLPDAVWFDIVIMGPRQWITVREHGTNYATQQTDISLVKQAKRED